MNTFDYPFTRNSMETGKKTLEKVVNENKFLDSRGNSSPFASNVYPQFQQQYKSLQVGTGDEQLEDLVPEELHRLKSTQTGKNMLQHIGDTKKMGSKKMLPKIEGLISQDFDEDNFSP